MFWADEVQDVTLKWATLMRRIKPANLDEVHPVAIQHVYLKQPFPWDKDPHYYARADSMKAVLYTTIASVISPGRPLPDERLRHERDDRVDRKVAFAILYLLRVPILKRLMKFAIVLSCHSSFHRISSQFMSNPTFHHILSIDRYYWAILRSVVSVLHVGWTKATTRVRTAPFLEIWMHASLFSRYSAGGVVNQHHLQ